MGFGKWRAQLKKDSFYERATEIDEVKIAFSVKIIRDDRQLAFFYRRYDSVAETEHFVLLPHGDFVLDEVKGRGFSESFIDSDTDIGEYKECFKRLPYYAVISKQQPYIFHVTESQLVSGALEELKKYELDFTHEDRLNDFLNADKGIRINI